MSGELTSDTTAGEIAEWPEGTVGYVQCLGQTWRIERLGTYEVPESIIEALS